MLTTYVEIVSAEIVTRHESSLGKEKSKCLQALHCNEVLFVSIVQQIVLQRALSSSKALLTKKNLGV